MFPLAAAVCGIDTEAVRARAAPSLAALPATKLLAQLAEGMALVAEHVLTLEEAAQRQTGGGAARAAAAIRAVADEEAGKYLILLDAARCARQPQKVRARQLKRFNLHVPKGVYAEVVDTRPDRFRELVGYVDHLRASHYLDGPNDVDWVFRNSIEAGREERLYVDYVESDDGRRWISPARWDFVASGIDLDSMTSGAVLLLGALHRLGFSSEIGLTVVDRVWRDFIPQPSTRWGEVCERIESTLEQLAAAGAAGGATDLDARTVWESWPFPLHSVEVEVRAVDVDDLRERQTSWVADQ